MMVETKQKKENMLDFKNLSNEELVVIYSKFNSVYENFNKELKEKRILKKTMTPLGPGTEYKYLKDEEVDKIKNSEIYNLTKSVVSKLKPVVELIIDCDADVKKLYNKLN